MRKKIIILSIVGMFLLSGFTAIGTQVKTSSEDDEGTLDQQQTEWDVGYPIERCLWQAQSFMPSYNQILTKVEISCSSTNAKNMLIVSIRTDLRDDDLTAVTIDPKTCNEGRYEWIECDFPDIPIVKDRTYYIICGANDGNIWNNCYIWDSTFERDIYDRGERWAYYVASDYWSESFKDDDMCFKTYGIKVDDNQPPSVPEITVETSDKAEGISEYNFMVSDPDEDGLFELEIFWGDGRISYPSPPALFEPDHWDSGYTVSVEHKWEKGGTYTIKARVKDSFCFWSDFGTLEVEIEGVKTKSMNLYERFPLLQNLLSMPMINRILQLF